MLCGSYAKHCELVCCAEHLIILNSICGFLDFTAFLYRTNQSVSDTVFVSFFRWKFGKIADSFDSLGRTNLSHCISSLSNGVGGFPAFSPEDGSRFNLRNLQAFTLTWNNGFCPKFQSWLLSYIMMYTIVRILHIWIEDIRRSLREFAAYV